MAKAHLYRPAHGGYPTYSPPPPWWPDRDYPRRRHMVFSTTALRLDNSWARDRFMAPRLPAPLADLYGYWPDEPVGEVVDAKMDGDTLRGTVRFDRSPSWADAADRYRKD